MYEDAHLEMQYEDRYAIVDDLIDEDRAYELAMDSLEGYCDYCEKEGHTFRSCPKRDDEWGDE